MSDRDDHWSEDEQFFCQACLEDKPKRERSEEDFRYCNLCQPVIEGEYRAIVESKGRPLTSLYKPILRVPLSDPMESHTELKKSKMSTLIETPVTVDNFRPPDRPKTYKKQELPEPLIKEMKIAGMGAKAIATRLKVEQDINVSYKTIQRMLSGERKETC